MRPEAGQLIALRYRLERPLASGGMGTIWVAKHLQLDVAVAVKFMSDDVDDTPSARVRFEREAKAAARITSPHVVRAYDYGVEDGTPFMAMELLEGESLETRLRREASLTLADAARIARQVAKGLHEAHALGIVHRDLKPANIFLARVAGEEVVKILDFGIAKDTKSLIEDDRTKSGTLLGSPHHMSPEQARGADIDTRSDLWSLGVVLFRAVSGHRPFSGTNMGDVIAKICGDAIPKPSSFAPWLGPPIDAFFERALRRSPDLRFQSVREMASAFDEAVAVAHAGDATVEGSRPALSDAAGDGALVVPRSDETRDVPARTSVADTESTAIGTTSDQLGRASKGGRRRYALGALVIAVVASAVVFSWVRFAPHAPAATPALPPGAPAKEARQTESPLAAPEAPSPSIAASAASPTIVVTPAPSESSTPEPPRIAPRPPPHTPRPNPAPRSSGSPFF